MSAASRSSSGRRSGGRSERRRFEPAGAAPFLVQNYYSEKSQAKPDNANDNTYWGGKLGRINRTAVLPSHPSLFTFSLSRRNFGSNYRCGKCDCEKAMIFIPRHHRLGLFSFGAHFVSMRS